MKPLLIPFAIAALCQVGVADESKPLPFCEQAGGKEIEFFIGHHEIHGRGTFDFLCRHLKWPAPARKP